MNIICPPELCTGCAACFNACAHKAISMAPDEKGFLRPQICEEACTDCGLCRSACPAHAAILPEGGEEKRVYAAWCKDGKIRRQSTSGGLFTVFAEWVLARGGVVAGVAWRDGLDGVHHVVVERKEDLHLFRGSKYVQSDVGCIYRDVRQFLRQGRKVLFSGTPCQVHGLKTYLDGFKKSLHGMEENLFLIDVVCHGVPSKKVFLDYKRCVEEKYGARLTGFHFRKKDPSWLSSSYSYSFENKTEKRQSVTEAPYFVGFVRNYTLRECCYRCKYSSPVRHSDVTLSDFWGYLPRRARFMSYDKGTSMVLVNTEKGREAFEAVRHRLTVDENVTFEQAVRGNHNLQAPQPRPADVDAFWNDYRAEGFARAAELHFPAGAPRRWRQWRIWVFKLTLLLPRRVVKGLSRLKHLIKK